MRRIGMMGGVGEGPDIMRQLEKDMITNHGDDRR